MPIAACRSAEPTLTPRLSKRPISPDANSRRDVRIAEQGLASRQGTLELARRHSWARSEQAPAKRVVENGDQGGQAMKAQTFKSSAFQPRQGGLMHPRSSGQLRLGHPGPAAGIADPAPEKVDPPRDQPFDFRSPAVGNGDVEPGPTALPRVRDCLHQPIERDRHHRRMHGRSPVRSLARSAASAIPSSSWHGRSIRLFEFASRLHVRQEQISQPGCTSGCASGRTSARVTAGQTAIS
jgi:hypothetical protein